VENHHRVTGIKSQRQKPCENGMAEKAEDNPDIQVTP
jgi:hypothetical protein